MKRHKFKIDKNLKKKQKVIFIQVEGESECNYFNYIKKLFNLRYQIKIEPKSTFKSVKEEVSLIYRKYSVEKDEIYFVYDTENDEKIIKKFINNSNNKINENIYLCSVSFEVFLLIHFENNNVKENQVKDVKTRIKELEQFLPNYIKGNSYDFSKTITHKHVEHSMEYEKHLNSVEKTYCDVGELIFDLINK